MGADREHKVKLLVMDVAQLAVTNKDDLWWLENYRFVCIAQQVRQGTG